MKKLTDYMANVHDRPKTPRTVPLYKLYSDRLRAYLILRYMTPLPFIDQVRARRELKIVKSIRRKLKRFKLVLRVTDKSGIFHIGRVIDYERKATQYRRDTGAYEELTSNPFDDTFMKVIQLLNKLRSEKKIQEKHKMDMLPVRNETELAYMYFLPKSHKVKT